MRADLQPQEIVKLANNLGNWVMFSDLEKEEIQDTMKRVGICEPSELVRVAILEYVDTIKDNPQRWIQ